MLYETLLNGSIRVLTLHPATNDGAPPEPIVCTLRSTSPENAGRYDALSYVWGSANSAKDIILNGQTVQVTDNLDCALRHVRLEHDGLVIWIDQLCINQADTGKRSQQVALMGEIYSRVAKVVAWLGEVDSETKMVWELLDDTAPLQKIGSDRIFELTSATLPEMLDKTDDVLEQRSKQCRSMSTLQRKDDASWQALRNFIRRP